MTSPSLKSLALCLFFLAAFSVNARQKRDETLSKRERRQKLYPELVRTVDLAEGAPAPLRALALLRVASVPLNKDEEWKRDLLEEAFDAASQSPIKWRVNYVSFPEGPLPAGLPRRILKAMEINNSGLDRLTLQTEIVLAMLPVDKQESLTLFHRIAPLGLAPLTCSDGLVPNVDAYYQTATQLAKDGFTLPQRNKREHLQFLRGLAESMTSSTEVGPAARMLLDQHLSSSETGVLAAVFGHQLGELPLDCRSFSDHLDSTSKNVMRFADSLEAGDAIALLKSWRAYLVGNLSGVRCGETVDPKSYPEYTTTAANAVKTFNLRAEHQESLTRIEEQEIQPGKIEPKLPEEHAVISEQAKKFHDEWWWLMFGGQRTGLTDAQKNTAEWKSRFEEYVNEIENLEPSGDSDADLLAGKCDLMRNAVIAAPAGPERDYVLARYVALLKISNIQPELLPQWYSAVHGLIDIMQSLYKDRQSVLKSLESTGDPLLSLMAAVYKLDASYQKEASASPN